MDTLGGALRGDSPAREGGEQRSANQGETSPLILFFKDKNYGI